MSNENKPTSRQSVDAIRTVLTQSKEFASFPPNVILLDICSDTCIVCWPSGTMWKCTTRGTHIYHITLDGRTRLEMESDTLQQTKSFAALTSVAANKRMYTKKSQKRAKKVQELEAMLAYPSTRNLRKALEGNVILNCPVTSSDVLTALRIYGPNPEALVGKTTRRPSKTVELPSNDRYPVSVDPKYRRIVVCSGILTVVNPGFLYNTMSIKRCMNLELGFEMYLTYLKG